MKNLRLTASLIFLFVLMAACTNGGQEEVQKEKPDEQHETEKTDDQDRQPNDEPTGDDNSDQENQDDTSENDNQDDQDNSDEHNSDQETNDPQKVEAAYELKDNGYFKPIEDAEEKVVLFTIDDAPDKYALEMAKTLKELDVPAIFFVNGIFMQSEEKQKIIKEIHDMGFEIGNHTYGHTRLSKISQEEQKEEIISLSKLIEEITGEKPKFFRAPNGDNTEYASQLVKDKGMLLMNWSFGYDYINGYMEKEALIDITLNTNLLGNGSNILMHDRSWTKEALPQIVKGLRDKGFSFIDPDSIKTPQQ